MNFIAHRGDHSTTIKENTIEAFERAIENPDFLGFECDVRTSKDGVFVIHHDILIDGHLVNSLTIKELKEKYKLPTLEEVLNLKTDKKILIEIKEPYLDLDSFCILLKEHQEKDLYVFSFYNTVIQWLSKKQISAKLGVLNYVLNSEKDYSEYQFIGILSPIVTENLIAFFKERNIEVFLYGIRELNTFTERDDVICIVDSSVLKK